MSVTSGSPNRGFGYQTLKQSASGEFIRASVTSPRRVEGAEVEVQYVKGEELLSGSQVETVLWTDSGFYAVDVSRLFLHVVGYDWEVQVEPPVYDFLNQKCIPDKAKTPSLLAIHARYSAYEERLVPNQQTGTVSYADFASFFYSQMGSTLGEPQLTEIRGPEYTEIGLRRVQSRRDIRVVSSSVSSTVHNVVEMFVTKVEQTT